MTSLRGAVVVSSPGAPPVRATAPGGGRVLVAPGVQGPPGHGVNLAGAVATYADLPELTVSDAGQAFMVQDDGRLYVWSGVSWPADGAGAQFRGEMGPEGRGIEVVSVDGNDLLLGMSDGSTVRASVPALAAAVAARDVAVAARADAVSARTGAESARDGAVDAASRAEGAAAGVAADAVAAGDAAGRAEVAADAADASAAAAGVSAGDAATSAEATAVDAAAVGDARDFVEVVHQSLLPGGVIEEALRNLTWSTQEAADRAEAAADGVDQVVSNAADVLIVEIGDLTVQIRNDADAAQAARDQAVGAASQATTKADEAAADAAAVGDAREFVSGVHESLLPGGEMMTTLEWIGASAADHATQARDARDAAEGHADRAATEAGAAAQIAAAEKIAELVGEAPSELDTIYELAAAFEDRGDAIAAIQDALANRVVGNHSSVISSTAPGAGTPTNQVTFVVEGT